MPAVIKLCIATMMMMMMMMMADADDDDNPDGDDGLAGELMATDEGDDLDEKILHNVALFFLKLQVVCGVPAYAIQSIVDGLNNLLSLSHPLFLNYCRHIAGSWYRLQSGCYCCQPQQENSPGEIYRTRRDSILYTQKKHLSYYRGRLPYVQPTEFVIGQRDGKQRTCTYGNDICLFTSA